MTRKRDKQRKQINTRADRVKEKDQNERGLEYERINETREKCD